MTTTEKGIEQAVSKYTLTKIKSALIMTHHPFWSDGNSVILDNESHDGITLAEDGTLYINSKEVTDEEFEEFVANLK